MTKIFGFEIKRVPGSNVTSTRSSEHHLRKTRLILYSGTITFCIISEALGAKAISGLCYPGLPIFQSADISPIGYVNQKKFIDRVSAEADVFNRDFINAFSYNGLAGLYVAIMFALAVISDLLWPDRNEGKFIRQAWRVSSVLACAMAISATFTVTIILSSHSGRLTGVSADEERFLLAHVRPEPVPLVYKRNKRGVASVVFIWFGTLTTIASTVIMWHSLNHVDTKDTVSSSSTLTESIEAPSESTQRTRAVMQKNSRASGLRKKLADDAKDLVPDMAKIREVSGPLKVFATDTRHLAAKGLKVVPGRVTKDRRSTSGPMNSKKRSQATVGTLNDDAVELVTRGARKVQTIGSGQNSQPDEASNIQGLAAGKGLDGNSASSSKRRSQGIATTLNDNDTELITRGARKAEAVDSTGKPEQSQETHTRDPGAPDVLDGHVASSIKRRSRAIDMTNMLAGDAKELFEAGVMKIQRREAYEELEGQGSSSGKRRSQVIDLTKMLAGDAKELLEAGVTKFQGRRASEDLNGNASSSKRRSQAFEIGKVLADDAKELLDAGVAKLQARGVQDERNGSGPSGKRRSQAFDLGRALADDAKELLTAGVKKVQGRRAREGHDGSVLDWNGSLAGVRVSFSVQKQ